MTDQVINFVIKKLVACSAQNIKIINFIQDHMLFSKAIIATGVSSRHISVLADDIRDCLRQQYKINTKSEGHARSEWILIDVQYFMVNLLQKEVREKYKLEEAWSPVLHS